MPVTAILSGLGVWENKEIVQKLSYMTAGTSDVWEPPGSGLGERGQKPGSPKGAEDALHAPVQS